MREILPGIQHWKARHPKIGLDVSSYLLPDSGTALDPMLPAGEGASWIGHDVSRSILTCRHHLRSVREIGAPVLVHESGLEEVEGEGVEARGYRAGEELAPGIVALEFGRICADDAVLLIDRGPGALAFGDGLINEAGLGHPPDRYLGEDPEAVKADIVEGLVGLLDHTFDALLFAHGEPLPGGGRELLEGFVDARR